MGSIYPIILYFALLVDVILAADFIPKDNILLNCGSFDAKTTDSDGRNWTSDNGSKFLQSSKGSFRASATTEAPDVGNIPYMSARIFHSNATYSFPVSPGRIFLRLYFYPNVYSRSNSANAVFSVTAGPYTLLRNFNASQTAKKLDAHFVIKEYSINVDGGVLTITFIPSPKSFAFVNGIEVVSMPSIYDNDVGANIVGTSSPFQIDNSTALENLYRLNVGGNHIPPTEDTGLFRSWYDDTPYKFGTEIGFTAIADPNVTITFPKSIQSYTAPVDVYATARFMTPDSMVNLNFNLTWLFPIDTGFAYLIRMHFCQIFFNIDKINQIVFNVYLNNQTAFPGFDVVALTSSNGIPNIQDFVVILPTSEDPQQDLWVGLHPDISDKPQYYNAFLNGLEIFKINNTDGTLAPSILSN